MPLPPEVASCDESTRFNWTGIPITKEEQIWFTNMTERFHQNRYRHDVNRTEWFLFQWAWKRPLQCGLHHLERRDLETLFANEHVMIIGDSHCRQLFNSFTGWFGWEKPIIKVPGMMANGYNSRFVTGRRTTFSTYGQPYLYNIEGTLGTLRKSW